VIVEGLSHSKNFIIVFSDVTEELQNKKELENKAYYDTLTNIYSRERFDYYLNKRLNQKRVFSIIMFDIDHFKGVNDTYGHDIGDNVLKEITELISLHIRKDDIFARWGGEEFMIIVNTDVIKAERFANKLRRVVQQHTFNYVDNVTCSFGVVKYRDSDTVDIIIKRVDTMLYSAKESGRNCVVVVN
jgi:diguanylate cyclase (GGDEF)-like protein